MLWIVPLQRGRVVVDVRRLGVGSIGSGSGRGSRSCSLVVVGCERSRVSWVVRRRRSPESCSGTPRSAPAGPSIGPRPPKHTLTVAPHDRSRRSSRSTRAADHHRRGGHYPVPRLWTARTDVRAALGELEEAGVSERPQTVLADAGYWHTNQIEHLLADGFQVPVPPDSMVRDGARPGWEGGMYSFMRRVLCTDRGRELYNKRRHSIEPVFRQIKHNRAMTRSEDASNLRSEGPSSWCSAPRRAWRARRMTVKPTPRQLAARSMACWRRLRDALLAQRGAEASRRGPSPRPRP